MSKDKKRWDKIRNNPKTVTFDVLITALRRYGFEIYLGRGKGSHARVRFVLGDLIWGYTIPRHRQYVKAVYVKGIIAMIDDINNHLEDNND